MAYDVKITGEGHENLNGRLFILVDVKSGKPGDAVNAYIDAADSLSEETVKTIAVLLLKNSEERRLVQNTTI